MHRVINVVTGTSTGVGKTVATAALAVTATGSVVVVKPVQSGALDGDSDAREVARLAGVRRGVDDAGRAARARHRRPAPGSRPAARGVVRRPDRGARPGHVIVEGAGGLLVRLDAAGGTLLDLASLLDAVAEVEVVVVVAAASARSTTPS